jgi:hypothetical protein
MLHLILIISQHSRRDVETKILGRRYDTLGERVFSINSKALRGDINSRRRALIAEDEATSAGPEPGGIQRSQNCQRYAPRCHYTLCLGPRFSKLDITDLSFLIQVITLLSSRLTLIFPCPPVDKIDANFLVPKQMSFLDLYNWLSVVSNSSLAVLHLSVEYQDSLAMDT